MAHGNQPLPSDFDVRDPAFARDMLEWSLRVQFEIHELVAGSNDAIAASNALMAQTDQILDRK